MKTLKNYNQFSLNSKINENIGGSVRTRYAPSPTGKNHIGGVRTALYNYLFAKQHHGKFILRIEDTDLSRFDPEAEKYIKDTFDWLGLEFDESPSKGGPYGPYKQSERRSIYDKYVQELIDNDKAYYSFDTSEDLESARENIPNFSYNFETRYDMKNSLTLPKEVVDDLLKTTNNWVIRIKYPDEPIIVEVDDIIRGKVRVNTNTLDDKVIWKKKDELPTYHLANIVDDHLMKITHVIRGEEWLPSAPLHVYLYQCFGWDAPQFAHLPLILGPTGGKLSKRDGDKYGFPVFPLSYINPETKEVSRGYREDGYLPETVLNMLAFIGWNPGTEKEIYSLDELIKDFDLSRVSKAGAKFNQDKAAWFNKQYIKDAPTEKLVDSFKIELDKRGIKKDYQFIYNIVDENKGKVSFIKNLYDVVSYLFEKPTVFDDKAMKKWKPESSDILKGFADELSELDIWKEGKIHSTFEKYVADNNIKFGDIGTVLRLVLTGQGNGPSLFGIIESLGKKETLDRLYNLDKFKSNKTDIKTNNRNLDSFEDVSLQHRKTHLTKELGLLQGSLKSSEGKLSNKNFVDRAPAAVVEAEKEKIIELRSKILDIEKELSM